MGNNNHVAVSHKLYGFQGRVGGRIVMMEPVVVAPKFQSFSLHIFSQASQNVTVKVRVDHSVGMNKFMLNNPLHIKKTMRMLFAELWNCCTFFLLVIVGYSTVTVAALFLDHNHKSNFRHPL
jgi:hypothetical protein